MAQTRSTLVPDSKVRKHWPAGVGPGCGIALIFFICTDQLKGVEGEAQPVLELVDDLNE